MQINRLFEIIYLLLNKKCTTAKELAEHFEVSQRTIYRDIETLSQAGIPIYTNKGKGGGISLLENFVLNKSILSQQEQNEILSALQGLSATNDPESEQVLSKLSSLFGTTNSNWIEVDFTDWSNTKKELFQLLKTAVTSKKVICFDYYSSYGEKTSRIVEPLQLWFKEKAWYVKAYCREKKEIRTFKINRMKNLKMLGESFERQLPKEQPITENSFYQPNIITLKLKIDASQSYRVYDEFEENQIHKNEDGSFLVTVSFPEGEWVYGYILSFGCYAEVLEPPFVREIIKKKLQKNLEIYL